MPQFIIRAMNNRQRGQQTSAAVGTSAVCVKSVTDSPVNDLMTKPNRRISGFGRLLVPALEMPGCVRGERLNENLRHYHHPLREPTIAVGRLVIENIRGLWKSPSSTNSPLSFESFKEGSIRWNRVEPDRLPDNPDAPEPVWEGPNATCIT